MHRLTLSSEKHISKSVTISGEMAQIMTHSVNIKTSFSGLDPIRELLCFKINTFYLCWKQYSVLMEMSHNLLI